MGKVKNKLKNSKIINLSSVNALIKNSQLIQQTITCSKTTIENVDKGVKYVQS